MKQCYWFDTANQIITIIKKNNIINNKCDITNILIIYMFYYYNFIDNLIQ